MGFTDSDHFQPGSNTALPKLLPSIVTRSSLPFGKVRVSSGLPRLFFSIALILWFSYFKIKQYEN
jgi:hypothetical protein